MTISKAPRAHSHKTLHADVLGCSSARSIMASVSIFCFSGASGFKGQVGSQEVPLTQVCTSPEMGLHWVHVLTDFEFISAQVVDALCAVQKILLFQPRHSVEVPGIHSGQTHH